MRLLTEPPLREVTLSLTPALALRSPSRGRNPNQAQRAALRSLLPRFGVYEDGELVPPSRVAARTLLRHLA